MIVFHGTPITPATAAAKALAGRNALVSFRHPSQLEIVEAVAASFIVDNGAFSAWVAGEPVTDWTAYYRWVEDRLLHPACLWAICPDVIDGTEEQNDALLEEWPHGKALGGPVWHLHEGLDRLERLASEWPRVCLGSSGEFAEIGTVAWWRRIAEAMDAVTDEQGRPTVKLHGLRMADSTLRSIPFSSVDSTNVGQNIGLDSRWTGTYQPPTKEWRAVLLAERMEAAPCATVWVPPAQTDLFGRTA